MLSKKAAFESAKEHLKVPKALARALKAGVLDGVDASVFFKEEKGAEAVSAATGRKAAKAPVFAGQVVAMLNSADLGYAVEWPSGFRSVTGAASQEFSFPKYKSEPGQYREAQYGGLGQPLSMWAMDGTQPLLSGDVVAWYHPAANQVYDCAGSTCSVQVFPLPRGHWGSPDRIYLLDGGAGDAIHGGDKVYFDRKKDIYGTFNPGASLRATNGGTIGGVSMASRTVFVIKPPEPVDCAGAWSKWTDCTATCGGGTSTREYAATASPQNGGKECPLPETNSCALDPCPVDCIGFWGAWSECSVDCAIGTVTRPYNITREAQYGGRHCPEKFKSQMKPCDTGVTCPPRNSKGEICQGVSPWPLSDGCELRECNVVCQCTHPDTCTFPCECTGRETTTTTTAAVPNATIAAAPATVVGGVTDLGADQKFFLGAATTTAAAVNTATALVELIDCDKLAASLEKVATRISDIKAANLQNAEELYSSDEGKVELAARNSEWAQLTAQVHYYETEKTKRSCVKPAPAPAPALAAPGATWTTAAPAATVRVMTLDATNKEKCTFCPLGAINNLPAPSKAAVPTFVVGGKDLPVLGLQHEGVNLRSADFAMASTLGIGADGREVRSYQITQGEIINRYEV
jgi:hypothetical protein